MSAHRKRSKHSLSDIFQNLFQGVIVIAPIVITVYAVWWLFTTVDGLLPNILSFLFPTIFNDGPKGFRRIPGLGFIVVILLLYIIGRVSSTFLVERLVHFIDRILEKTPGVKLIYSSVKDFLEAFGGNKKKFDKPVLVNVDSADVWRIGFITQNDAQQFGLVAHVVVYVPHSYALSGITYIVPLEKIKPFGENIKSADAMKFTVSGGVTELETDHR